MFSWGGIVRGMPETDFFPAVGLSSPRIFDFLALFSDTLTGEVTGQAAALCPPRHGSSGQSHADPPLPGLPHRPTRANRRTHPCAYSFTPAQQTARAADYPGCHEQRAFCKARFILKLRFLRLFLVFAKFFVLPFSKSKGVLGIERGGEAKKGRESQFSEFWVDRNVPKMRRIVFFVQFYLCPVREISATPVFSSFLRHFKAFKKKSIFQPRNF